MNEMINWLGGRCPVKTHLPVSVVFRNGKTRTATAGSMNVLWNHDGSAMDIVKYRVVSHLPLETAEAPGLLVSSLGVEANAAQDSEVHEAVVGREYTGGSVSYYSVRVTKPTRVRDTYTAECNDIIEALGMNYAEGNAFKAIWRSCAARNLGLAKAGYKDGLYDAEKVVFFGQRMVEQASQQSQAGLLPSSVS